MDGDTKRRSTSRSADGASPGASGQSAGASPRRSLGRASGEKSKGKRKTCHTRLPGATASFGVKHHKTLPGEELVEGIQGFEGGEAASARGARSAAAAAAAVAFAALHLFVSRPSRPVIPSHDRWGSRHDETNRPSSRTSPRRRLAPALRALPQSILYSCSFRGAPGGGHGGSGRTGARIRQSPSSLPSASSGGGGGGVLGGSETRSGTIGAP